MGGHVGGEVASQLAADTIVEALNELGQRPTGSRIDLPG